MDSWQLEHNLGVSAGTSRSDNGRMQNGQLVHTHLLYGVSWNDSGVGEGSHEEGGQDQRGESRVSNNDDPAKLQVSYEVRHAAKCVEE